MMERLTVEITAGEIPLPVLISLVVALQETVAISLFVDTLIAIDRSIPGSRSPKARTVGIVRLTAPPIIGAGVQAIIIALLIGVATVGIVLVVVGFVRNYGIVDSVAVAVTRAIAVVMLVAIPVAVLVLIFVLVAITIPVFVAVFVFIAVLILVAVPIPVPVTVLIFVFIFVLGPVLGAIRITVAVATIPGFVQSPVAVPCYGAGRIISRGAIPSVSAAIAVCVAPALSGTAVAGSPVFTTTPSTIVASVAT